MTIIRGLASVVSVLALCAGNIAVCAGWQPTPEARMACCANDTTCPTHKPQGHDHSSSKTQGQADTCCAASAQRRDSSTGRSAFAVSGLIAPTQVVLFTVPPAAASEEWRALVPLRASPIPRHLLLSVFLV